MVTGVISLFNTLWVLSAEISLSPFLSLLLDQDLRHAKGATVKNHLRATLGYLGFSRQPKVTLLFSEQFHIPKELYFSLCFDIKFLVSDS